MINRIGTRIVIIVLLLVICSHFVSANNERFFDHSLLGARVGNDYYGPIYHDQELDYRGGFSTFLDSPENIDKAYFAGLLGYELFELDHFLGSEVYQGLYCPISVFGKNIDYIQYLFRLLTLSYLYESLQHHLMVVQKLNAEVPACSIDWQELLNRCSPQSSDMHTFLRRSMHIVINNKFRLNKKHSYQKFLREWFKELDGVVSGKVLPQSITIERINHECAKSKGLNCSKMDLSKVKKILGGVCKKDSSLFMKMCSEKDQIYGISYVSIAYQLLTQSNVMSVINQGGYAKSCMKRYVALMSNKEMVYPQLNGLYEVVYSYIRSQPARSDIQGALFLPGALKEFDLKGLQTTIYDVKTPAPTPTVEIVPTPTPTPVVVEVKPTPIPKVVKVEPTPEPTAIPTPTPRISAFEQARQKFGKLSSGKREVDVDMNALKDDFIFTTVDIEKLKKPLLVYQTRNALSEMKMFDKLGEEKTPVRLLFLKYLIDMDQHKGLYNIIGILGDKFYVFNDIDNIKKPVYIELLNNEHTGWQWQIKLVEKKGEE